MQVDDPWQSMHPARAVLGLALLGAPALAQATWTLQSPLPTSSDLRGVSMVSAAEGWAVGTDGEILHTQDGGATWTRQPSGTSEPFNAVYFLDAQHGWAVGNQFARTVDGGVTWQLAPSGTTYGVDFVDTLHGWAVGNGGVAYRTLDGGATWSSVAAGNNFSLKDVDFVDVNTGWAVGGGGQILHSTNGGQTWTPQTSGTNAWLDGVCFVSPNEGFVVGWGQLLHTTDAGGTWQIVSDTPDVMLAEVTFLDSLHGWAVGDTQKILRTVNGGSTWIQQTLGDFGYLESVSFTDAQNGAAVGARGHVFTTTDGGISWVSRRNGSVSGTEQIDIVDSQHVWAANVGEILHTADGGAHWRMLDRSIFQGHPYGIDFIDRLRGWTIHAGRRSYRTSDGGTTWSSTLVTTESSVSVYDIDALDAQTLIVVGGHTDALSSRIYRSTNGGVSWQSIAHPQVNWTFYAADFANATTGWAVGNSGGILMTTDAGATWSISRQPQGPQLLDVSFADTLNGWAVGPAGLVLHTADGGQTWDERYVTSANLASVSAVSPSTAWISGTGRTLARTRDGGATWEFQDTSGFPGQGSFPAIAFADAENGWAGYSTGYPFGQIYRRAVDTGTPFCSGDGSATPCPCGNAGAFGRGCASSVNPSGALLAASGTASVSGDTLVLLASGMPNTSVLYFQGTSQQAGGLGTTFGDGLRCGGGTILRIATELNSNGASQYPMAGDPPVSVRGGVPPAGGARAYQAWYRNSAPAFCTPALFNLTNGLWVEWAQ